MTTTLAPSATTVAPVEAKPDPTPRWVRPAFFALLAGTAILFLWNLSASGYGNGFYAAATQSATQSWKAWLFGSLDSGNVLTVDKPPAFLWVSGLFARIFGFSTWTVLAPQALEGVAAVALLYATVKRTSGPVAGLLAGVALALTPVATLVFRFNLPDALLVLLMIAAAYCVVRSLEKASPWWLALAGSAIGFAFLAKMGQALLVLPALGLVYLVAAPTGLGKRLLHLLGAAVSMTVSAGWFIVLVELWPADSRPYIGGSTNDSLWELAVGYNGLGRLFGQGGGGGGGLAGGGNTGFGGASGIGRMFGASFGSEVSWLLPAALVGLVAGLWFTRRAPRTSVTRAALVLWGGWMVVTALVFSFMSGIIHPYYTVALAPGIVGTVAIAGRELWRGRAHTPARATLAAMVAVTGFWAFILLNRVPTWLPFVRWVIVVATVVVATAVALGVPLARKVLLAALLAVGLLGTVSYSLATAATSHSGSIPTSGPGAYVSGGFGGGMGGPGEESSTGGELTKLLQATTGTWAAATVSSQSAASLELSSGKAVIGIGGWSGSDPAPTLAEFQQYVADGRIGYYVPGGRGGGGMGGGGGGNEIATWVAANFTAMTVDGTTVYDLSE
ncbi:ArnT family glycosyltransferase [Umezawaea tangerina]|uniref:4-amino-4-deoxy-L-arabinose transferase-like glycosyltransferase n=1 Tax=Umezawaea tangerina TaxID=84725 RepID=A0A2T0T557_9PSEU|nr:glycosyltransferase family 39 protein [Umezawaea tangerina]PRY40769.1 4-amino-4-deoxy-L-arabinose transferase-like glycosyltransferase [Umezawaea tangerina]